MAQQIHKAEAALKNLRMLSRYKTAEGLAAAIPHAPVYTVSNDLVGSVLSQDDEAADPEMIHSVVIELKPVLGVNVVTVTTNTNPDPAGTPTDLTKTFEYEVIADDASAVEFADVGDLVDK